MFTDKKFNIATRLSIQVTLVMFVVCVIFALVYYYWFWQQEAASLEQDMAALADAHGKSLANPLARQSEESVHLYLRSVVAVPEVVCAVVDRGDGTQRIIWPENCAISAAMLPHANTIIQVAGAAPAQLEVRYSTDIIAKALLVDIFAHVLLFFYVIFWICLASYLALRSLVGKPLALLNASIQAAESGERRSFVPWSSSDELGTVVNAYNSMIEQIDQRTLSLEQARAHAEAATRAKSRFLASMSHELRTPLSAVLTISEMMRDEARSRGEETEPLERVNAAGQHLRDLIDNILDFSKIEAEKIELRPEVIEISTIINDLNVTIPLLAEQNNNTYRVACAVPSQPLFCDQVRLRQLLMNLLVNACKFTQHGEVHLSINRIERNAVARIEFVIADTGIGMSEQETNRVFDEFVQADDGVARRYGGSGLGLAISQRLCRLMGAELSVESEPGVGSTFRFELPVGVS